MNSAEDILNPDSDALEACLLIAATFQLVSFLAEEDALYDHNLEVIRLIGIRRLKNAWSKITGLPVEIENKTDVDFEEYIGIQEVISEEITNGGDVTVLFEQFSSYLESEELQKMLLAFIFTLAVSTSISFDEEDINEQARSIMILLSLNWGLVAFLPGSDEFMAVVDKYNFRDMADESKIELSNLNHSSGKDVESGACFIATAVLDENHESLVPLRWFRDNVLIDYQFGRKFVAWYYSRGPLMAEYIAQKPVIKWVVKSLLVIPLSAFIKILK